MPQIVLPKLHAGQVALHNSGGRLNAVRCGRRWGKTKFLVWRAARAALAGKKVGIFTPEHKQTQEPYDELLGILAPVKLRANKNEGTIRLKTRGVIDFWTLTDNPLAGRGREYDEVLGDEVAFSKDGQMFDLWARSIKPTLLTTRGSAWFFGTPNGVNPENFFYKICHDEELGFRQHYAPTSTNPYVPADELERERVRTDPRVWSQEFLAEFVDWSGAAFFDEQKMLIDGEPPDYPEKCHQVFAVIDTAVKTGQQNDGTAVLYVAQNNFPTGPRLYFLDWDVMQIEGALLETWLPTVFENLEHYAQQVGAIYGSIGAYIEDRASGMVLLQQAINRGWPAMAIDSKLTSVGKEERAISVSGYFYRGEIKIARPAYEKVISYKGTSRNHLMSQLRDFRIGQKRDGANDDLLDCATYAAALALGDSEGF